MIDINPVTESTNQFRYVLSPGATPNSTGYLRVSIIILRYHMTDESVLFLYVCSVNFLF